MSKGFRPTESDSFAGEIRSAGELLCETLGVVYHPRAAIFYAQAIRDGDATALPWPWTQKDLPYLRRRLAVQIEVLLD